MILHDHEGKEYRVRFEYGNMLVSTRRATACRLETPQGNSVGIAECSLKDQFVKSKGRKIAFTKALHKGMVPRQARTALWQEYLSKTSK